MHNDQFHHWLPKPDQAGSWLPVSRVHYRAACKLWELILLPFLNSRAAMVNLGEIASAYCQKGLAQFLHWPITVSISRTAHHTKSTSICTEAGPRCVCVSPKFNIELIYDWTKQFHVALRKKSCVWWILDTLIDTKNCNIPSQHVFICTQETFFPIYFID